MIRRTFFLAVLIAWSPPLFADDSLNLGRFDGKVVIVDFWASWCVPCRRSFPWMNEMHDKYADAGLVIIAVNVDRELENAATFLAKYPAKFEIIYSPKAELAKAYEVEVMPTSLVFGRDGGLLERHAGFKVKKQDEYEAVLRSALK